jgi:hypothetical protein
MIFNNVSSELLRIKVNTKAYKPFENNCTIKYKSSARRNSAVAEAHLFDIFACRPTASPRGAMLIWLRYAGPSFLHSQHVITMSLGTSGQSVRPRQGPLKLRKRFKIIATKFHGVSHLTRLQPRWVTLITQSSSLEERKNPKHNECGCLKWKSWNEPTVPRSQVRCTVWWQGNLKEIRHGFSQYIEPNTGILLWNNTYRYFPFQQRHSSLSTHYLHYKRAVKLYSKQCVINPTKVHIINNYLPPDIRCLIIKITATMSQEIKNVFLKHSVSIIRSKVYFKNLTVRQPLTKLAAFYGIQKFTAMYNRGCNQT